MYNWILAMNPFMQKLASIKNVNIIAGTRHPEINMPEATINDTADSMTIVGTLSFPMYCP
jgi:hypothetical protein